MQPPRLFRKSEETMEHEEPYIEDEAHKSDALYMTFSA
jgi:hypothetical protein